MHADTSPARHSKFDDTAHPSDADRRPPYPRKMLDECGWLIALAIGAAVVSHLIVTALG